MLGFGFRGQFEMSGGCFLQFEDMLASLGLWWRGASIFSNIVCLQIIVTVCLVYSSNNL